MEIQNDINLQSIQDEESSLLFQEPVLRRSQNFNWYDGTIASIQLAAASEPEPSLNVYQSDLPVGVVVPTVDAVGWSKGSETWT